MPPVRSYWLSRVGYACKGRWRGRKREHEKIWFHAHSTEMHQAGGSRLSNATERSGKKRRKNGPRLWNHWGSQLAPRRSQILRTSPFMSPCCLWRKFPQEIESSGDFSSSQQLLATPHQHKRKWHLTTSWCPPPHSLMPASDFQTAKDFPKK